MRSAHGCANAPLVGWGDRYALVVFEDSDIEAIRNLHDRLHPANCKWRHPKADALGDVLAHVEVGKPYRLAVSSIGDQANPGRAVAEALELAGDLESFEVIRAQVPLVERRHKVKFAPCALAG